jgi:hypothetical protein
MPEPAASIGTGQNAVPIRQRCPYASTSANPGLIPKRSWSQLSRRGLMLLGYEVSGRHSSVVGILWETTGCLGVCRQD